MHTDLILLNILNSGFVSQPATSLRLWWYSAKCLLFLRRKGSVLFLRRNGSTRRYWWWHRAWMILDVWLTNICNNCWCSYVWNLLEIGSKWPYIFRWWSIFTIFQIFTFCKIELLRQKFNYQAIVSFKNNQSYLIY